MHPKKIENLLKLTDEEGVDFFVRYWALLQKPHQSGAF